MSKQSAQTTRSQTRAELSFSLTLATTVADIRGACAVRAHANSPYLPGSLYAFAKPEDQDRQRGTAVLLCRSKKNDLPIGTLRIQTNTFEPLQIENSVVLPPWLMGQPMAEITRLAIAHGADALTRLMLMKASYLYCLANQVRWLVIGAHSDALIRLYRHLGFFDVLDQNDPVSLPYAGGLPHRILAFDIQAAEQTWQSEKHGLYPLMIETFHPDLQLFPDAGYIRYG